MVHGMVSQQPAAVAISLGRALHTHTFEQSNDDDGGTVRQAAPASAQQQSVLDGSPHRSASARPVPSCFWRSRSASTWWLSRQLRRTAVRFIRGTAQHAAHLSLRQQQTQIIRGSWHLSNLEADFGSCVPGAGLLVHPAHTVQACNDLGQNVRAGSPKAAGTTVEWPSGSRGE